jgi:3D (Asp-Asp-Asp) domain-containing protein
MPAPALSALVRPLAGRVLAPSRTRPRVWAWVVISPALVLFALALLILLLLVGAAQQQRQDCGIGGPVPGDFTGPGSLGGVAGTGLTPAQVRAVQTASPFAGSRLTPGAYDSTAYGPPWGGIQGAGLSTSGGLAIGGAAPRWYVIAVDPAEIAHGQLVYLWPNPFAWTGPFLAADTGGAIRQRRIDFYDWRGRASQYRWGARQTRASARPIIPGGPTTDTVVDASADQAACTTIDPDGSGTGTLALPGAHGRVSVAPLANAPGKPLRPELLDFLRMVAGVAGRELVLTTGTNHSELTVSGQVSDHVLGLAGDFGSVANHFPIGGGFGTTLAAAALRAAGLPEAQALALAAAGGGHNVCHDGWRVQVIWRTGGHYDHVHIGLRHGCTFTGVQSFQL